MGGLSAALFLAKNGKHVVVFGQDKTAMHWALLKNYLGVPEIMGTAFQQILEFRTGEAVVFGAGLTIDYELTRALHLSGGGGCHR